MKKLQLSKETLVSLNPEEATHVGGAIQVNTLACPTVRVLFCQPSLLANCTITRVTCRVSICPGCPTQLGCPLPTLAC